MGERTLTGPGPLPLVFILSSERSGSTLLRVLLGNHSALVAPSELWLMQFATYRDWRQAKPAAMTSVLEFFELVKHPLSASEVDRQCADWSTSQVYGWMSTFLGRGQLLVDKTPGYSNSLETLAKLASFDARYIWLVRHPLAVIDSSVRLAAARKARKGTGGWKATARRLVDAAEHALTRGMTRRTRQRELKWVQQNSNIADFLTRVPADRWCRVRFEALVRDPEQSLRVICATLNVPFEHAMLSLQAGRDMTPGLGDPNFSSHLSIDAARADEWKGRYQERNLAISTRQLMQRLDLGASEA